MARVTIASLQARIAELEAQLAAQPAKVNKADLDFTKAATPSHTEHEYPFTDHRGRRYRQIAWNQRAYAP